MKWLTVAVLWLATGYRLRVSFGRGHTIWRTYLAVGIGGLALTTTLYFLRAQVDDLLGVPNLTGLLNRVLLTIACVAVQLYILSLDPTPRDTRARAKGRVLAGAAIIAICTASWVLAPIHDQVLLDYAPRSGHPAVLVYTVAYYAYLMWLLIDLGTFVLRHAGRLAESDRPGAVCAGMIGVGCLAGVGVLGLFTANVLLATGTGTGPAGFDELANALFPIPMALVAGGLLAVGVIPAVAEWKAAQRQVRILRPLWQRVVTLAPQVRLHGHRRTLNARRDATVAAHRVVIEVADGLHLIRVDPTTRAELSDLAAALQHPQDDGIPASQLLTPQQTHDQDLAQLLDLARRYADLVTDKPKEPAK